MGAFSFTFAPVVLLKMYYRLVCLLIIIINYTFYRTKCGICCISHCLYYIIVVFIRLLILI
jgi:hypothetical protein